MAKHNFDDFDPYHKWLGIPKKQRPPTHYVLLGISLDEEDAEVIRGAAEQRRRFVESKRGDGHEAAVGEVLYQIDEAELTLLNSEMRRDYDRRLNLFRKRRRSRQVDPNATRSRIESRPGKVVGEGSGIVGTFVGVMAVLLIGFGLMAWFSFQLPWSQPTQRTPEQVAVTAEPEATESTPKETTRNAVVDDVASTGEHVEETSTPLANTTSEAINEATLPVPVLYLPCDPSVATVPPNVAFTRKGGRYAAGKIGQAVSFDGNSYTELEASLPLGNAPRTMAFWVRNERGPVKHIVQVVTQTVRWEKAKAFGIIEAGGNWRFHDMNGGLDSSVKIDREWHHLAITHDGKTICFFLDGKKVAEADRNLETESRKLRIGGLGSPENNFVGLIDELYVFDVPLTENQIRQLMNGAGSVSGPIASHTQRTGTTETQGQDLLATTGRNLLLNRAVHPDQSISVISTTPLRFLVANPPGTVLMEGRSFEDSRIVRTVLSPSRKAGEYDEQYAGIGGAVRIGKTIIAVFHAEKPTGGQTEFGAPRFYATIGLAISEDNGNSFRKIGPIISGLPENPSWKGAAQGNGDPTLCLDHTGEWLYCFYTEHSRRDPATGEKRSVITCMARSRVSDRGMPGTWHKLYKGAFSEPGLGGKDTEVANVWAPHVQYLKGVKKYVMVGNRGGVRLFHSDDGIKWSRPTELYRVADLPYGEFAWHPSFFIERERGDKANGVLFYGYSPDGKVPPYMYGRTIAITTSGDGADDNGETLRKNLAGTKWINSNNVTFEWTKDGRVLHAGNECEWKVIEERQVEVNFGSHWGRIVFDNDLTSFKQGRKSGELTITGRRQ